MDQLNAVDEAGRSAEAAMIAQRAALEVLPSAILSAVFKGQL